MKICEFVNSKKLRLTNSFLCSSEPIVSPYSRRILKPFIRRDFDTEPAKLKILRAIQARGSELDEIEARSRLARDGIEARGFAREDIEARRLARVEIEARSLAFVEIEARGLTREGGPAREDIEARGLARVEVEAQGLAQEGSPARDDIEARGLARVGIEARDIARDGIEARGCVPKNIEACVPALAGIEARGLASDEIKSRGFAREESVIILEQHPLDYCYVQPAHIPAVNRLASRLFWPGK